ncbi:hypothetical protein ABK040_010308 [Willaertia magna]
MNNNEAYNDASSIEENAGYWQGEGQNNNTLGNVDDDKGLYSPATTTSSTNDEKPYVTSTNQIQLTNHNEDSMSPASLEDNHSFSHSIDEKHLMLSEEGTTSPKKKESMNPKNLFKEFISVIYSKAFLQTLLLNFSILTMCAFSSSTGPLLKSFAKLTDSSFGDMGSIFIVRGVGQLCSTLICGFLLDAIKRFIEKKIHDKEKEVVYKMTTFYTLVIIALFIMIFGGMIIPFVNILYLSFAFFVIWGFGSSIVSTSGQALLFWIWEAEKRNVSPFAQLFHFSAGLGLFLGPFIVFIVNKTFGIGQQEISAPLEQSIQHERLQYGLLQVNNNISIIVNDTLTAQEAFTSILGTHSVICILFFISILFFGSYIAYSLLSSKKQKKMDLELSNEFENDSFELEIVHTEEKEEEKDNLSVDSAAKEHAIEDVHHTGEQKEKAKEKFISMAKVVITSLISLSLFNYCSVEGAFGSVVYSYLTEAKIESDSGANLLNSLFWLTFTAGRATGITVSTFLNPYIILSVNILLSIISLAILWLFSSSNAMVWIGCILFGFALSTQYPTSFVLPSADMGLQISGLMTSVQIFSASTGAIIGPSLTVMLFKSIGPNALLWISSINISALVVLYIVIYLFGRYYKNKVKTL